MTATHAQLILAILQQDVFTLMQEQSTVTIIMHVPLMDAQLIKNNAGIRMLIVMITILALLIHVIQSLDVFTLHSLLLNWMTVMHVPQIFAPKNLESNILQSLVTMEINAVWALATQKRDVFILELFVMITTNAPLINVLMELVYIPQLNVTQNLVKLPTVIKILEDV
jgi:hypothetical protein